MEKSLNVVEKISDQLYVITETESVHCYLVIGSDKAMLFDIGYGYENIMPLVRTITDLPVMLVLSHGDPDHGLGSKWFDEVWIHPPRSHGSSHPYRYVQPASAASSPPDPDPRLQHPV